MARDTRRALVRPVRARDRTTRNKNSVRQEGDRMTIAQVITKIVEVAIAIFLIIAFYKVHISIYESLTAATAAFWLYMLYITGLRDDVE